MSPRENETILKNIGICDPLHQKILIEHLPCGIMRVKEAIADGTPVQVNAARALLICTWKGMVAAFRYAEAARDAKQRAENFTITVKR